MNKKLLILLIFLFLISSVNAYPLVDTETKNNFTVNWYLSRQGISKLIYEIDIVNLENEVRQVNLSSIFEGIDYPSTNIKNVKLMEYEEKKTVTVIGDVNTGYEEIINYYYKWTESKPIFSISDKVKRKDDYSLMTIGKLETKKFELTLNIPINRYEYRFGSETKIFLELDGIKYHPWYNISWFFRTYLYNFTAIDGIGIKRISYNTRIHKIENNIRDDCFDLRITDTNNSELEYNLVEGCLTDNTTIDIEFPSNITSIYVYYGFENALNVSNSSIIYTNDSTPIYTYNYTKHESYISLWNINEDEKNATHILDKNDTNNNDGLLDGASNTSGVIGDALVFDGTNDYVNITNSTSLNNVYNSDTISISVWINTEWTVTNNRRILTRIVGGGYNYLTMNAQHNIQWLTTGLSDIDIVSVGNISNTTWTHIVVVYNSTDKLIYINGTLDISEPANGTMTSDGDIYIGRDAGGGPDFFNGSMDEIYIFNRDLDSNEVNLLYNISFDESSTFLNELYPSYIIEYQQYSPLYASERTWKEIPLLSNYTSPMGTSIYNIAISLDGCLFNNFILDTNTFNVSGNVSRVGCLFGKCVAKKWDICVGDKVNSTVICREHIDVVDLGKSNLHYGSSGILPESIYTRTGAGENSHITKPARYGFKNPDDIFKEMWYLAYPKELNFISNCANNDITVRFQNDLALEDVPTHEERTGTLGYLSSLLNGMVNFLFTSIGIITFGFSLLGFVLVHPWLIFILFEIFTLMYSIQSTYTISEFIGTYVEIHKKGIEFIIMVLEWLFAFIMRVINAITNLFPL